MRVWPPVEPEKDILMVCDDDDLIHKSLVETIMSGELNKIRYVEKGYKWISGTTSISELVPFHSVCGTSLAIPACFYKIFNRSSEEDEAIMELGSHKLPFENMKAAGREIEPFDFFAAVYRVKGANSTQVDVARAMQLEKSGLSRFSPSFGRRLKRLARPFARDSKGSSEQAKLEAGTWFCDDFLGGRPVVQGKVP